MMMVPRCLHAFHTVFLLGILPGVHSTFVLELSTDGTYGSNNHRLFLGNGNTTISCRLTGGTPLAMPSEPIANLWNSSWHKNFTFSSTQTQYQWEMVLTRASLDTGDLVESMIPKEQWKFNVDVIVDGVTVSALASVLDKVADPLLFWTIGTLLSSAPSVLGVITRIRHSPCLPDVAMFAYKTQASSGCVSTDQLLDLALTNHRLVILTTAGLHISNDLRVYDTSNTNFLTFETVFTISDYVANAVDRMISYAGLCAWRQYDLISSVEDIISIVITDNTGTSRVWYAKDPFTSWQEALSKMSSVQFIDSMYNLHMSTMNLLVKNTIDNKIYCEVIRMNNDMSLNAVGLVRPFEFPSATVLSRLYYLPLSSFLFATGEEVWLSEDGGNTFTLIHALTSSDVVKAVVFDQPEKAFAMETQSGAMLYGKPGVHHLATLSSSFTPAGTSLHIDALGRLYSVSVDAITGVPSGQEVNPTTETRSLSSSFDRPLAAVFLDHKSALLFEHEGIGASGTITSLFSSRNVGQEITAVHGGTGLITEIKSGTFMTGFLTVVKIKITSSWARDSTTSDLQKHTLGVTYLNQAIGTAQLYLDSYQVGDVGWSDDEISKTVVIPGMTSFLITGRISSTHVEATAVMYTRGTILRPPRTWYILDLGVFSGVPSWSLKEPECLHSIERSAATKWKSHFEMDFHDRMYLISKVFNADSKLQERPPWTFVTMSNPWLFKTDFKTDFIHETACRQLNISLANYIPRRGITSLRFQVSGASLLCEEASHIVLIYSGCPCLKRLRILYPQNITDYEFLHSSPVDNSSSEVLETIPINYRPPSKLGVGVPTSVHIYNVDPSKPRPHNTFSVSKATGELKQCEGAADRVECGCTDYMRLSSHPDHSDCKERVFRLHHPGVLRTHFIIEQFGREDIRIPDRFLVKLTEINDRAPAFSATKSTKHPSLYTMIQENPLFGNWSDYFVPNDLQVVMNGSGLYHYRSEIIAGVSLCDLHVYFQYYVDQTPIAYPLQYVLNFGTALIFGGVFFGLYLWYFFNHHVHRVRRVGSQCLETRMIDKTHKPPQ